MKRIPVRRDEAIRLVIVGLVVEAGATVLLTLQFVVPGRATHPMAVVQLAASAGLAILLGVMANRQHARQDEPGGPIVIETTPPWLMDLLGTAAVIGGMLRGLVHSVALHGFTPEATALALGSHLPALAIALVAHGLRSRVTLEPAEWEDCHQAEPRSWFHDTLTVGGKEVHIDKGLLHPPFDGVSGRH